jgi:hypothetical protein
MLEKIQKHLDNLAERQNNTGILEFEGYSPNEMNLILYEPFVDNSPVQLNKLSEEEYLQIPIIKQVMYLANIIKNAGELKLTAKGYLPVKVVSELCSQNFMPHIDLCLDPKIYKELDSPDIMLAKFLLDLSGIIKKRHNKLSLTKFGEKLLRNNEKLFRKIFTVFTTKYNMACFDGYGENGIGQFGSAFSLILLRKYGNKKRLDRFYSDKYFDAFPLLFMDVAVNPYSESYSENHHCYSIRTFDRFLHNFGLIEIEQEKKWNSEKFIRKTDMFDRLINVREPKRAH